MAKRKTTTSKVQLGTMTVKYTGQLPAIEETLEQLEKNLNLASARLTYALDQKRTWEQRCYNRSREFDAANTKFKQKKNGFTDAEIRDDKPESTSLWTYAE